MKILIAIPTYKHRYTELLSNLNNIDKRFDILVVTQDNDPNLDEYKQYTWDSNISILQSSATNIFEKRQDMLEFAQSHDYDAMIQVDDDVRFTGRKITAESKRTTSNSYRHVETTFNDLLDITCKTAEEYHAGYVSLAWPIYLSFNTPGARAINHSINFAQFGYVNVKMCKEANVNYDTSGLVNEDSDLVLQLLQHGINCICVKDYAYMVEDSSRDVKHSAVYSEHNQQLKHKIGLYLKWRCNLTVDKHGDLKHSFSFRKYWNTFELPIKHTEYDDKLYELCKTYNIDAIINYIKENKK